MNLPNQYFEDFPIEFKQINPEDFPHFEVEDKLILGLNNGYIGDSFIENISINESNTVVLNCGVGSGKTTAIIKAIKQFYEDEEYVIFVASPFVSLVQQYYLDIQEKAEIPIDQIYRNEWIGELNLRFTNRRVHIVTINTLLGNPGEDSPINSQAKRKYLNDMVNHCEEQGKKVIFIYDEIHDSIHNFKEKYIFNLWKWRNVIHKNFVISATYNEASKIVIEYLAELTHNRIRILEADRIRIPEKLSDLFLYYDNGKSYTNSNGNLVNIVENVLERGLDIDILCFSKKLCKSILTSREEGVGKLLYEKYGDNINDCTSGLEGNSRMDRDVHRNRFNKDKCNIGTNFKSGVSIEKDNHAFILIFPPVTAKGDFKNGFGIFSGGINSIIQAIARKRKKGEIHILLPRPTNFNFDSFPFDEDKKEVFKHFFEPIQYQSNRPSSNNIIDTKSIDYIELEQQNELLREFYNNELRANVESSISYLDTVRNLRQNKVRLEFPEFKLFMLEDGENYISNKFKFLGGDLSGYLSYCAATNQFVNCNLFKTNRKPIQNFKLGKLQYCFDRFFKNYFDDDWFNSLKVNVSDKYIFEEIRNELFNNNQVKLYDLNDNQTYLKPYEERLFETQLIAFFQRKLYRNNNEFVKRYEKSNGWIEDMPYTRGEYFLNCISHAGRYVSSHPEINNRLARAYESLNYFRSLLITNIKTVTINNRQVQYISNKPSETFCSGEDIGKFELMIATLIESDTLIANEVFDFKKSFIREENRVLSKQVKAFYNIIKNDFLETEDRKLSSGENVKQIRKIIPLPKTEEVINFITESEVILGYENMPSYDVVDGHIKRVIS